MINDIEIVKKLATGGQKTVFLGKNPELGYIVVKKGKFNNFATLERIKREIDLLSELNSEYFPCQFSFNIDVKNKEFEIVEEFIEGTVLRECINQYTTNESIWNLIINLSNGLKEIWERSIVHRDLKPENIIIRPSNKPCILDLGIARFLNFESITQTISPFGPCTPNYAAPEQLNNKKSIIDHRTDFFALGIIALELYLKVHPFNSDHLNNGYQIYENILTNSYILATDSVQQNEKFAAFAEKTLKTEPYERFRNYSTLMNFLINY